MSPNRKILTRPIFPQTVCFCLTLISAGGSSGNMLKSHDSWCYEGKKIIQPISPHFFFAMSSSFGPKAGHHIQTYIDLVKKMPSPQMDVGHHCSPKKWWQTFSVCGCTAKPHAWVITFKQSQHHSPWRIIPVSKWLITMVSKSPKWGCSPYKWPFHGL